MRRVVITGLGIVSPIGNNAEEVTESLKVGRSGIVFAPDYAEHGFRSQVHGMPQIVLEDQIDKRNLRFMGPGAAYNFIAMEQAIKDSGLEESAVSNPRTGLIMGSGGPSTSAMFAAHQSLLATGATQRIGPFAVPKTMASTVSANLATAFHIKGMNFSITSACSTSLHCIGMAAQQVALGTQDIMFAGGGEELHWALTMMFDAMGALSSKRNDDPTHASRPYDADRDGFVIAGGGGMLVLEDYEHAKARGAHIHAELIGYGVTSDGADMVAPSGEGAVRCMRMAMAGIDRPVDYLNTHGTSTPLGDITELNAVREVFGDAIPPLSSTKALSGHSLGAASVHEAIYSLLMLRDGFIAGSANIETLDPRCEGFPIVRESRDARLDLVASNSFGFGGTNSTLVFARP